MRERLWSFDEEGEPWLGDAALENPSLILANPPRRRKKAKGRMPPQLAAYWRKRMGGGGGGKRKRAKAHGRRRKPLRNPPAVFSSLGGAVSRARKRSSGFVSQFPDIETLGGVAVGFVAPSMIFARVKAWLPESVRTLPVDDTDTVHSAVGYWAVKLGTAILPPLGIRKFISRKLGNATLVGGVVSFVVDLAKYYFPSFMSGQPMLGFYTPAPMPTLDAGPVRRSVGMGMYTPGVYPPAGRDSRLTATVPTRFQPQNRF